MVKKHYDILKEYELDKYYLKKYDDKLNNKKYNDFDHLKDDHYELATYFQKFILRYYLKESEINDKFHYTLKTNDYILEETIYYDDGLTINNNKEQQETTDNLKEQMKINNKKQQETINNNKEQ